ncbi:MAG: transposase [Polyangiaceae bacterium]
MSQAFTGAVVAVQRTDSALRLNVHLHALVLDGVYVHQDDDVRRPLKFLELDTATHEDIAEVAARTAARVEKILRAHGRSLDPALADETPPELTADDPALAACYAAAAQGIGLSGDRAGLPPLRLITAPPDRPHARDVTDAPIAEVRGINVHAAQVVDGPPRAPE